MVKTKIMMVASLDAIIEAFPHPTIQPIVGQPAYETIAELNLKLNANAASIHSNRGNGQLGLLFLTVKPAVYDTQSNTQFIAPANPGQSPVIPANSTGPQITELRRQHKEQKDEFMRYDQADKALKSQLIGAVDEMYIRTLRDKYILYAKKTTLQILTHLYDNYARISQLELKENDHRMNEEWDPNQPIEVLYDQIEDAVEFASAGKAPYTTPQVVNNAYNLVSNTGLFEEECKKWRKKATADKTWDNFKTQFTEAHQDLRDSQRTARDAGYQANSAEEEQEDQSMNALQAIEHLANATIEDRETIATLTKTNSELVTENSDLTERLVKALEDLAEKESQGGKGGGKYKQKYCWSHGACNHMSKDCNTPKPGHKAQATKENKMGGA